ncbi:hypothetical protein BDV38DRAFT_277037 [Aspergillus pseudotamarii]|uniref:Uncharacterized protein n=1 Tax=Aspergillus pseudotamarii TaxID=132259 RepID=A0A5N6TC63_ASPPS|nr:uncharacterized protein BDV38DRAFT_277037 [Aspergillus pseudotamarii]KAE8143974.1 hypothetical protein BDV38DRAFT_277037 [Aspergillus pseudotamarii]
MSTTSTEDTCDEMNLQTEKLFRDDSEVTTLCLWTDKRYNHILGLLLVWANGYSSGVLGSSAGIYHEWHFESFLQSEKDIKFDEIEYLNEIGCDCYNGLVEETSMFQAYVDTKFQCAGWAFIGMEITQAGPRLVSLRPMAGIHSYRDRMEYDQPEEESNNQSRNTVNRYVLHDATHYPEALLTGKGVFGS